MKQIAFAFSALALAACQATDVGPRTAGDTVDKSTDEGGLWMQSEKAEQELARSGLLIKDPVLNAYVNEISCKVAPDLCSDIRIYLLESSSFNAFMFPNGAMVVFSGLMLRAENEAQLATVIGHEIGHFEENHGLERHRTLKRTATLMALGDLATGGLGTLAGILAYQGYSRTHEREADAIGFRRLAEAGYAPHEAGKIWAELIRERQASQFMRTQRRATRSSLLDSHPAPPERAETLKAEADALGPDGETGAAAHRNRIAPFLDDWLDADLRARDYGMSLYLIDRLSEAGRDMGVLTYYRAEAHRMRGATGDLEIAQSEYEKATRFADAPAKTWRALGEIYRKSDETAKARQAYQTYLQKQPDAEDAALIRRTVERLDAVQS